MKKEAEDGSSVVTFRFCFFRVSLVEVKRNPPSWNLASVHLGFLSEEAELHIRHMWLTHTLAFATYAPPGCLLIVCWSFVTCDIIWVWTGC